MRTLPLLFVLACKGTPTVPPPPDCTIGFADRDGDGFGNPLLQTTDCVENVVQNTDDCNDGSFSVHPDAPEICDNLDNDCDGLTDGADDSLDVPLQFPDGDGDGFGTGDGIRSCQTLEAHVEMGGDCDDEVPEVNPAATEICDEGIDNDCNDLADDDDPNLDTFTTFYVDADMDGVGAGAAIAACEAPVGTVAFDGDCDDTSAVAYPGALEICDDLDQDCDGDPDTPQFSPDPCVPYEAPWEGSWTLSIDNGTAMATCTGTASLVLDSAQSPPVQGTFTCALDNPQPGWDAVQTGSITGVFRVDGSIDGTVEAFEGQEYDWTGSIAGTALDADGQGLFIQGGAWDLNFAFALDYIDVPP
ncbi:MAG: putative metal-binding motif-containing protein [Alphaproteobacteria bacterium]|nr:putative metal-binding motif-containing protein [Alphaproteobacteria bacterium]